jgi:hypothetical protein
MIFHCTKLHLSYVSATVLELSPYNRIYILNFKRPLRLHFNFFHKNCLIKSCSYFEDLSGYKVSWYHVEWCKVCIHLRSLNVRYFEWLKLQD